MDDCEAMDMIDKLNEEHDITFKENAELVKVNNLLMEKLKCSMVTTEGLKKELKKVKQYHFETIEFKEEIFKHENSYLEKIITDMGGSLEGYTKSNEPIPNIPFYDKLSDRNDNLVKIINSWKETDWDEMTELEEEELERRGIKWL
tara:strand:+ start:91 stop:528 length:438 start_codon:yes stop_codon:yes gene_type:complete